MRILRRLFVGLLLASALAVCRVEAQTQPVTQNVTATAQCVSIRASGYSTVGIIVSGTWSGTFTPNLQISNVTSAPTVAKKVVPVDSTTAQATVTANGGYRADVAGFALFNFCSTGTWTSGTATVTLNVATPPAASTVASGGGGSVSSGTQYQLGLYAATGTTIGGDSLFTDNGTILNYIGTGFTLADPGTSETLNWSNSNCSGTACATANEYVSQTYDGANGAFEIVTKASGTGVQRPLWWGATGAENWGIDTSGELKPFVNNSKTLGTASAYPSMTYTNGLSIASHLMVSGTAPTISSGFGTSPSIVANNGTAAFTINVGTGGTASSGVIGFPAATTGWAVHCDDVTTNSATVFITKQTGTTTTTATIASYSNLFAAGIWAASDILVCQASAY